MSRSTRYDYRVVYPNGEMKINDDFIAQGIKHYYYESQFEITDTIYRSCLRVFDQWRKDILNHDPDFSWDQFTKLPYLLQSLKQEQELRFPIVFYNDSVHCGSGRVVIIRLFCPNVLADRLIITDRPIQGSGVITSMTDLEQKLLIKNYIRQNLTQAHAWNFHVDQGIVFGNDFSTDHRNCFPFCKDSEKNHELVQRIKDFVLTNPDLDIESLLAVISQFDL